jgi:hypothetical protein
MRFKKTTASEYQEQCALFDWVDAHLHLHPELKMMFATLNGLRLPIGLAMKAKKQGNRKGVPDVFLMSPRQGFHGLVFEMKVKPNKLTKEQEEWMKIASVYGYCTGVCYSVDEAIELVKSYLGIECKSFVTKDDLT